MRVVLLDTKTGIKTSVPEDLSYTYWTDGNGSCDCNRRIFCGAPAEKPDGVCEGCERFLIVEVVSLAEGDAVCTLAELNRDYPTNLKKKHAVL